MRVNLIPMAGEGQRFKNASYQTPKPLLSIDGVPMVVRAAQSLPPADKYVFVCQQKHLSAYPLEQTLKQYFDNVAVVSIHELSEGQAITCMMAMEHIHPDAQLTIGASDNGMHYDIAKLVAQFNSHQTDALIWTFKGNPSVLQNVHAYSWVETVPHTEKALRVSCKEPVSNNPLNDHALVGAFSFRHASVFFDAVADMVKEQARINNEFYIDMAMNFVLKKGYAVTVFEVDKYLCWGTPQDYQDYLSGSAIVKNKSSRIDS